MELLSTITFAFQVALTPENLLCAVESLWYPGRSTPRGRLGHCLLLPITTLLPPVL